MSIKERFLKAVSVFRNNRDPTYVYRDVGVSYGYRPDRVRLTRGNERTLVTSIYNRIAIDVSSLVFQHVKLDGEGRYTETINSDLNSCLTLEANIDQDSRDFIRDIVLSMFDEGSVGIVPTETSADPELTDSYKIYSMRTGQITQWYPRHVKVRLYNDRTGQKEDVTLSKHNVAIVPNPLYPIINEPNSTMKRLVHKLSLLDAVDERANSSKLDLIIQLPYVIKSEQRREQAEKRRQDIEMQLTGSQYGIAYTDGTERITQLNRPVENNLMKQIEYLTNLLYSQLGFHQSILDGTADEKTMLNYYNTTVEPIASAIVDAMRRTFLSKTARSQGQSIMFFRDPFKLVPVEQLAEIADKFTRNEIFSKNEFRQIMGRKPSKDPKADQLINSNLNHPEQAQKPVGETTKEISDEGGESQNGA
jgi:hypothetical protein